MLKLTTIGFEERCYAVLCFLNSWSLDWSLRRVLGFLRPKLQVMNQTKGSGKENEPDSCPPRAVTNNYVS